jgi:hypothetical protein
VNCALRTEILSSTSETKPSARTCSASWEFTSLSAEESSSDFLQYDIAVTTALVGLEAKDRNKFGVDGA